MTQQFDTAMQPLAKPKPAPEVGAYGGILVLLCLIVILIKQSKKS